MKYVDDVSVSCDARNGALVSKNRVKIATQKK